MYVIITNCIAPLMSTLNPFRMNLSGMHSMMLPIDVIFHDV